MGDRSRGPSGSIAPSEIVGGRYRIDRPLGTGGMAEVFAATDLRLGRVVALKRIPAAVVPDATARARMAREARALARVNHPNVVTVFDTVQDDGHPFLVMELVGGDTLRDALDRETRLEPGRAITIASELASGLAAAHAQGIVHRDLTPSNIFLTPSGTVKIGDFGIARMMTEAALTRTGEVFGSPPYVAPEQLTGATVDARADLYSVGCVLFEILSGRPPFIGDDPLALSYQHVHAEPVRIDEVVPGIAPELAGLVHRMLAKDPNDRPQTADEVRRALAHVPEAVAPADVTTVRLERTPTAVLPVVLPGRVARTPRWPSWLPWVIGIALVAAAMIAANAMMNGSGVSPAALRHALSSSPGTTSPSPTDAPRSPSIGPVVATPSSAAQALLDLARDLEATGQLDGHLVDDIDHTVQDVLHHIDVGDLDLDKTTEDLDKLREHVVDAIDHGDVTSTGAARLEQAIDRLGASLSKAAAGQGDEGD
jgi:eukaryotic-like serine/threonine-protein kinase